MTSLDVNSLSRAGCLKPGFEGGWEWRRAGKVVGSIGLTMEEGALVLDYKARHNNGPWKPVRQSTLIEWTPCRYGGRRAWFSCPGKPGGRACGRRAAKLFAGGDQFLCRHCYAVVYASQSEDRLGRAQRRAQKLRSRLERRLEARPQRMWQRTRERLIDRTIAAEILADDLLGQTMVRMLGRLEKRNAR